MTAMFYHLTRSTAEATARTILARAVGQGWRVMVRGTDPARLSRLDDWLWTDPDDSFLPHGMEGSAQDADQPVLIGQGAAVNRARGVVLLDGAQVAEAEARALERIWLLFDGEDAGALAAARDEWRRLTALGLPAQYWSEETGRWQMKTERKA
jgi:DNA polymerase III subunit chi